MTILDTSSLRLTFPFFPVYSSTIIELPSSRWILSRRVLFPGDGSISQPCSTHVRLYFAKKELNPADVGPWESGFCAAFAIRDSYPFTLACIWSLNVARMRKLRFLRFSCRERTWTT